MKAIAIIPARGGSKRLKNKNIYPLNGKPLLEYSIEVSRACNYIREVYVSSDSNEILSIGERAGAIGLVRPKNICDDETPKIIAIRYVVRQLEDLGVDFDTVIIVQANSPEIEVKHLQKGFELFSKYNLWEVMSTDENGVQNAAFRIVKKEAIFNEFLSAHCGFVVAKAIDVHTIDDILKLEKNKRCVE